MSTLLVSIICFILGALLTGVYVIRRMAHLVDKEARKSMMNLQLAHAMAQWVKIKQDGENLGTAIEKRGYKKIAIYGMADVGERLLAELKNTDIEVAYGIDQNAKNLFSYIELVTPSEKLEPVDAVIVTPLGYFDEIEEMLTKKMKCPILSIEDLMFGI